MFSCKYEGELTSRSSKKKQYELAKRALQDDFKDGAIFMFYDDENRFRFSFIRRNYGEDTKYTQWRRYTYFVDPKKHNKTFRRRIEGCKFSSLDEIQEAFSVEPLSKQFYKDLSNWYFASLGEVEFPNERGKNQYVVHANAMIRLITRLMFVWFMKQKGLVPDALFDEEKLKDILKYEDKTGSTYYKAILQNLFFATLNTEMGFKRKFVTTQYGIQNLYRYERFIKDKEAFMEMMSIVPFLNGGLFESLDIVVTADKEKGQEKVDIRIDCFSDNTKNEERLKVPDHLFFGNFDADISGYFEDNKKTNERITGIIDILNQYDFTIDENTPTDQEVALDPELLGLVFENLLASYNPETESTARKESGSFYTPRPIVDYMVVESLSHYLGNATGFAVDDLKDIFTDEPDHAFDSQVDKTSIIDAMSEMKIIDPACGSGAFPMGTLQKIVHALNKLDPNNTIWRASQEKRIKKELADKMDKMTLAEMRDRLDRDFNNHSNDPDYARKLYLIENCLYGVDIQPIAMQISKLRFFISLLVEQKIDHDEANYGIVPLPNLETKFIAANTLIKLNKPVSQKQGQVGQMFFKNLELEKLEEELDQFRNKYFKAQTPKTKRNRRNDIKEIRSKMADILETDGWDSEEAKKVSQWDPFDPNGLSEWYDSKWMFGFEGFDIVIGNPPYISLQRMENSSLYKKEKYDTYEKTGDLYSLFYEKGIELLKPNGYLCYITSNKWINANYGKSTRKYLATKSNPVILIDFSKVKIFESATVFVNILLSQRAKNENSLEACSVKGSSIPKQDLQEYFEANRITLKILNENVWKVNNVITQRINELIEQRGLPLRKWSSVNFFRGITTGFNKAFHIFSNRKQELVTQEKKSQQIIKPLLRGKDIKRWAYTFNSWYMINSHNGLKKNPRLPPVDVRNDYPAIYLHLLQFEDELKKRQDQGNHWTNLRDCAFFLEFDKPKIVWIEISDRANFTFDDQGMFLTNSAYFISGEENLKYILSILNSKVADFYLFQITATIAGGRKRYTKQYVEKIPIPRISPEEQMPFEKIADYLLWIKRNIDYEGFRAMYNHFEQVLNTMVYELYFEELVKSKGYSIISHVEKLPILEEDSELEILTKRYKETSHKDHPIKRSMFFIDSIPEIKEISKVYEV